LHSVEAQVRTLLKKYEAEDAAEEVLDIFRYSNQKKLDDSQVRSIRMLHRTGVNQRRIAEDFGINPATVSRIITGDYW